MHSNIKSKYVEHASCNAEFGVTHLATSDIVGILQGFQRAGVIQGAMEPESSRAEWTIGTKLYTALMILMTTALNYSSTTVRAQSRKALCSLIVEKDQHEHEDHMEPPNTQVV